MTKKIIPKDRTRQQDNVDLIACASAYVSLTRCPGGRIYNKGFVCLHCNHDTSYGGCKGVTPKIPDRNPDRIEKRKNKKDRRKK